jgi:membrane carboxypeptidase/penicillin-binding protein
MGGARLRHGRFRRPLRLAWSVVALVASFRAPVAAGRFALRRPPTITRQLVESLFPATRRSFPRKGLEIAATLPAERVLGRRRILEPQRNAIEWGPGPYGAEAAARYHYSVPARVDRHSVAIPERMRKMGW